MGGRAHFSLSEGGSITTSGQGSTGVLVQGIGGGGGTGGDSSTSSTVIGFGETVPEGPASLAVTPSVSIGGSGHVGGDGGEVLVAVGGHNCR